MGAPNWVAASKNASTAARFCAVNAMCASRFDAPCADALIQKVGVAVGAVADGLAEVHLTGEAQYPQHRVVETCGGSQVCHVDAVVIDHEPSLSAGTDSFGVTAGPSRRRASPR